MVDVIRTIALKAPSPASLLMAGVLVLASTLFPAHAQEPIKIGFSVSLTGGLASSGKAHLLSKQIWEEEINAKGGLLGRPVKLVYYDDQTNAVDRARHLRQADRRRQGRPRDGLCHQPDRRRRCRIDHRAQEDGHGAARRSAPTPSSSIRTISRARRSGPDPKGVLSQGILRGRKDAQARSRRRWRWSAPTPSSPTTC